MISVAYKRSLVCEKNETLDAVRCVPRIVTTVDVKSAILPGPENRTDRLDLTMGDNDSNPEQPSTDAN